MHSNLIDEDRSVKSPEDHSESVSALFNEPQKSQKITRQASKMEYNLCCRECRYRLIVRICIVAAISVLVFVLHSGNLRL